MNKSSLSLSQLNRMIKEEMALAFPGEYWIVGETSDVHYNNSGHCYLELVERNEASGGIVAKARAYIWSNLFMMLRTYFEEKTGRQFASGIKVLVKVTVDFHPLYGMGLTIHDIDPTYTLGDMQQRRQQILDKLEEEGIIDMNKELEFPLLPQRVAVITSPTAAGYGDFIDHLTNNPSGFIFYPHLFPATMQGDNTEASVIKALEKIFDYQGEFDVVTIIRGGGATSDLAAFDSYLLASHCAQFPLPVITGIGHERDNTVLDYVAYYRAKTPTAVADYLVDKASLYYNSIEAARQSVAEAAKALLFHSGEELRRIRSRLPFYVNQLIEHESYAVASLGKLLRKDLYLFLNRREEELAAKQSFFKLSSPDYILSKGYAIIYKDDKVVKSVNMLETGDAIRAVMADGSIESNIVATHRR